MLRKATNMRKLDCADQSLSKQSHRTRAVVAHAFRAINSLWCSCKARYQELKKRAGQVCTLMALANSYMA